MSAFSGVAEKSGIASGVAAKTLLQILAAANHRLRIKEVGVCFHGIVNTEAPVLVQLVRQSTAGTMSALTPVKEDSSLAETLTTTAQHTATAEPTNTDVLRSWAVHPQSGLVYQAVPGDEPIVPGAGRVGLVVTAGVSINVDAYIKFEE